MKHPIFKSIKLPGGSDAHFNHERGTYEWHKSGGYSDKIYAKVRESMDKRKWKKVDHTSSCSPDGSVVGGGESYRYGKHVLTMRRSIGCTKSDNFHSISLVLLDN